MPLSAVLAAILAMSLCVQSCARDSSVASRAEPSLTEAAKPDTEPQAGGNQLIVSDSTKAKRVSAAQDAATNNPVAPKKLEVVEGTSVDYGGAVFQVRNVMYSHLKHRDSNLGDNNSMCQLEVRHGHEVKTVTLARLHSEPIQYVDTLDFQVALEGADPYHSPARVWIHVRPQ